jgi:hypothetical protein
MSGNYVKSINMTKDEWSFAKHGQPREVAS